MQKPSTRWFDFPAIILLATLIFTASTRLALTKWVPDLYITERITFWGVLLGTALGYSTYKKNGVILLSFSYSLILIPWQILTIISPRNLVVERISELSARLSLTSQLYSANEAVEDPLILIVLMTIGFWVIALYVSYALTRTQNSLAVLLPSTLAILTIQYQDHRGASSMWMLGFYFFILLLLLNRLDFLQNEVRWKKDKVFAIPDEKFDLKLISTISFVFVILLAWNIPSTRTEWQAISQWWQDLPFTQNEKLDNLFSSVDNPNSSAGGGVFYGANLALGNHVYQGEEEILIIHVPKMEKAPPRFYWRVRSYDNYLNGSWRTSPEAIFDDFPAQNALPSPFFSNSELTEITFRNKTDGLTNLITSQQPLLLDIDVEALYTELPEGELDLNLLRASEPIPEDERYSLRTAINAPTIIELREARTEYPDWVLARYLQLPANLPESIRALATQLSADKETAYDITKAIINHLRSEIEYSTQVPDPPQGRDALEWFLFTYQKGYCNYSASAAVVLLRASDIPARLVVGFSQGERNEMGNFVVLRKNAHAWVEVYFPEIGWVEFEPTRNQTRILRPSGEEITEEEEGLFDLKELREDFLEEANLPLPKEEENTQVRAEVERAKKSILRRFLFWGMIALLTVALSFALWHFKGEQVWVTRALQSVIQIYEKNNRIAPIILLHWLSRRETNPIARAFYEINKSLAFLGEEIPIDFTPKERALILAELLPESETEIMALLAEHEKAIYSSEDGDLKIALHAKRAIRWQTIKRKLS